MNDPETPTTPSENGFQISDEPVLRARGLSGDGTRASALPAAHDTDLLYVIARDPKSLFIYWDLNWRRVFAGAGLSPRQVHLRIYRVDGAVEATREINPFLGHCYAEVGIAGTGYYCELGCFEGEEWTGLVRSGKAATPADRMAEELSAQFATLPLHLSFQRMLDILRVTQEEAANLARTVASLQEKARAGGGNGQSHLGSNGAPISELQTLLQTPEPKARTPGERAQWSKLAEELGAAPWGSASDSGMGGGSPA